ncbi:MAG: DEAD/DEAH box helicase family protein [Candidatus Heimdallarchaeota archaeon]|nr:DEAD/DEAH box helicase family protein [Candidatus Heimdallarchaeota archaeon]
MNSDKFLYEKLVEEFGRRYISELTIDNEIKENLNPEFPLRDYQTEALQMFKCYYENYFDFKKVPYAVLFNMATGSGKTLIMAGLILYLYKKGFRNFLFFVNSNNIINKTKDNFLNQQSIKYLYNNKLMLDGKVVKIREVNNFEGVNKDDINICFTTIQKLHSDLTIEKENSLTFNHFRDKKIVLIADEAHHGQVKTKNKTIIEKPSWENTIENILEKNKENILLEFTATMGFEYNKDVYAKYLDRLLYKYDLKEYVKDGYSKNIEIFRVEGDKKYRMLTAILTNQYRQDIASKYHLSNFKPVILFKAQKTINESFENHSLFRDLIDNLTIKEILDIKNRFDNEIIKRIFDFYEKQGFSLENLIEKIKINFSEKNCLNVNEEDLDKVSLSKKDTDELILQQSILNSLESKDNQIRAIFAVQKLNEGWDVLNLFDIVRVEGKQAGGGGYKGKVSPSTISEAQLIGRGARYYPFLIEGYQDKFIRKFDENLEHELRILEELYFHSFDESRYIAELKHALVEKGLMDEQVEEKELKLKNSFKKTAVFKTGFIYTNERLKKDYKEVKSFAQLGFKDKDYSYQIYSGTGKKSDVLDLETDKIKVNKITKTIKLSDIEPHIIKNAISKIDFYQYSNLIKYLPSLQSVNDLIEKKEFLYDLKINFEGIQKDMENISNKQIFFAVYSFLNKISDIIKDNLVDYIGSFEFKAKKISEVFFDKKLKLDKKLERADGDESYLSDKEWYVFNANYGTVEEKACVRFIEKLINENLRNEYKEIYLLRNELHFKIFNFDDGQAFAPDFVLLLRSMNGDNLIYQIFIEPKGGFLKEHDEWKEKFLLEIQNKYETKDVVKFIETDKHKIIGLPFYNKQKENIFKDQLLEALKQK